MARTKTYTNGQTARKQQINKTNQATEAPADSNPAMEAPRPDETAPVVPSLGQQALAAIREARRAIDAFAYQRAKEGFAVTRLRSISRNVREFEKILRSYAQH